jgi:hypothetical protein
MKLPPSIIEIKILADISKDYGAYMYNFIDTKHYLKANYLGIKKDKLPQDGGIIYWSSSENEDFKKIVQGDDPRLILEITEVTTKENYNYLQLKEFKMLKTIPNIKTNPATYNLSYGIPPVSQNGLFSKDFGQWFEGERQSDTWYAGKEKVSDLIKMNAVQIRDETKQSFVNTLKAELNEVGNNTKNMNRILILEGVGHKLKFEKSSDVVGGTTHGLKAAASCGVVEMEVDRVPYDVLKDKSEYFIRALCGFDNYDIEGGLVYKTNYKDGAKLLMSLCKENDIEPTSLIAKQQLKIVYNLGAKAIQKAVDKTVTDIAMNKKHNTKWIDWSTPENKKRLEKMVMIDTTEHRIAMCMTSGMYDYRKILKKLNEDNFLKEGQERKLVKVFISHPSEPAQSTWELQVSSHNLFNKQMFPKYKITFKELDTEESDTTKSFKLNFITDSDDQIYKNNESI